MASIVEIPRGHYALSATINTKEIKRLIEENLPVEQQVQTVLAASENASIISNACIADSGCTSYFFKSHDAFVTYNPIKTLVGQSSKSGANFSVLGFRNVEISIVNDNKRHTLLLKRSYQCPTDSCQIPVIPVDSGGFRRNGNWQRALPILPFLLFLIPAESLHSGITCMCYPHISYIGTCPWA